MKWIKRLLSVVLCLCLFLGAVSVPVHASGNDTPPETTEPAGTGEPTAPTTEELTPEGNLTLVDDIIDTETGKEFLTVVTKNGNYFYIIIERDDNGNRSVHFLNLVDERDLLELLSEEDAQEYLDHMATMPTEPVETDPTEPEPIQPTEPDSEFDPQMDHETMMLLAMPIVVLIVGGFAAYFIFSRKKPKSAPTPQTNEEDWDYDYDLPEEEDDAPNENDF